MTDWTAAFAYAARTLRRQPTFVVVALLTLALGIGANTAIFSVIKTVVLNPLPYAEPERIVVLWEVNPEGNQDRVSVPTFEDWQKRSARRSSRWPRTGRWTSPTRDRGEPRNVPGVRATPDLFTVLMANADARPHVRRGRSGGRRGSGRGREPRVLGSACSAPIQPSSARRFNSTRCPSTSIGVMPPGFEFPTATNVEVWTPLAFDPKDLHGQSRRARSLMVVGRAGRRAPPRRRRRTK